jgi:hypothetical protein
MVKRSVLSNDANANKRPFKHPTKKTKGESSDDELLRAVPITMNLGPALQEALEFVKTFSDKCEENPNWEEEYSEWKKISSWGSGTQEGIYEACNHTANDRVYDCVCHKIGDALGNMSEEPSWRTDEITSTYLLWLKNLIAETLMTLQPHSCRRRITKA